MKTLFLHIGMPKSATTSIQKFLEKNREVLLTHNFSYPDVLVKYRWADPRRNGHFLLEHYTVNKESKDWEKYQANYENGISTILKAFETVDNVILSDEGLWLAKYLKKILKEFKSTLDKHNIELKIIVYLRRQDLWITSLWNQKIKENRYNMTADEFIEKRTPRLHLDYSKRLKTVEKAVDISNIFVREFDKNVFE